MVSASSGGLSSRIRRMRGKRSAYPLAWRSERMMALKATSRTISGSTSRQKPWLASVCARNQAVTIANREGVVAENVHALAVSIFDGGNDDVEGGQLAL